MDSQSTSTGQFPNPTTDPALNTIPVKSARNIFTPKAIVAIILIVGTVIVAALGYYLLIYKAETNDISPGEGNALEVSAAEYEYINSEHDFSMILNKQWNVNEIGNKVLINTSMNGTINFEAFTGEEFSSIKEVDGQFCDSFETGFKEGLAETTVAEQFDFVLFEQNGIKGCNAAGEILSVKQRYNVFYNPDNKEVYTLFYTAPDETVLQELEHAMQSFKLNPQ